MRFPIERNITVAFPYFIRRILRGGNLLLEILADLEKNRPEDLNKEILRIAIIAELDAINIYEQMANMAKRLVKFYLALPEKRKFMYPCLSPCSCKLTDSL